MKILAFDQATNITAWCLWNTKRPLRYDAIDLHKEKNIDVRMDQMCVEIYQLIKKEKPDLIVLEDVSFQRDAQALINLARLQGRIMQMAYEIGAPVVLYKPSTWRKIVGIKTGKGIKRDELKSAAMMMITEKYGIEVSEDIAEAICIGECALKELKDQKGEKKK